MNIEITAKKLSGYILIIAAILILIIVSVYAALTASGTIQPIKVEVPQPSYGNEVAFGIILQIGMYGILVGVAFALASIGAKIIQP